jgi:Pyridoxamine 5'-phosphate oxidase
VKSIDGRTRIRPPDARGGVLVRTGKFRPVGNARQIVETAPATYWLATVRPDGRPHVMPILAVWVNGMLFFAAGQGTRKARNRMLNSRTPSAQQYT